MGSKLDLPDISGVRHWIDLSTLMIDRVNVLLHFDTFSILTIDQNREWYQKVAGVASGTVFFQDMPYRGSLIEHNVNLIEASGEPILFKFSQDFTQFTDKNIITNLKNFGQQQAIVTTLTVGPLLLGIISLDSYKADRYSREQFPILQSIAADIALAIKNILDQAQTGGTSALP